MSPEQFLDKLDQRGLIDPNTVERLRRQVAQATSTVSPQTIAKLLVDKGLITANQAQRLLAQQDTGSDELGFAGDQLKPAEEAEIVKLAPADPPPKPTPPTPPTKKGKGTPPPPPGKSGKPAPLTEDDLTSGPQDEDVVPVDESNLIRLDDAQLAPLDESHLVPVNDAQLVPLDESNLVPLDESNLVQLGKADLVPVDSVTAALEPTGGGYAPATKAAGTPDDVGFAGKKKRRENMWDSPWLLIGGGLLLVILGTGAFLFFILSRASADDLFKAAEESYQSQSYAEAIERYTEFLDDFSDHENAPKVRVRLALARLWTQYASQNWELALTAAEQQLPDIENDLGDDADARGELATILPGIGRGFTAQAIDAGRDAPRAQISYDQAQRAMKLVANSVYIPTDLRENPAVKNVINRIDEDLAIVLRGIQREERLEQTIKDMKSLAAERKTAQAFQLRKELLQDYPGLEGDAALLQAIIDVAHSERDLVATSDDKIASSKLDHPRPASAVFASLSGKKVDSLIDHVVVVLVRGAHYGLDVGTGQVLWRRFVGYETQSHPLRLSTDRGADALLVDGQRNEVLRVSAATGELRWRLPIGEPFVDPVIATNSILVPTESGKLIQVDPETGESTRTTKLPTNQTIHSGPGFAEGKSFLYQTGTHSNLYILSASDLECREVFYLGHKAGTVDVPPVLLGDHVLVIENSGGATSVLRVFETEQRGLKLVEVQNPVPLVGHVVRSPVVMADKLLIATTLGAVYVFEPDFSKRDITPLKESASYGKRFDSPVVGYPAVSGFHVWVADSRLTRFEYQPAMEKIDPVPPRNEGDAFLGPLHVFANTVISVRRPRGESGVTVAATERIAGSPIWETHLGVPMAGDLAVVNQELIAVSAQAKLFQADESVLKSGYRDQSTFRLNVDKPGLALQHRVDFGDGRMVFMGPPGGNEFLSYYPTDTERPLRLVAMQMRGRAATAAIAFQGQLLVASSDGLVYCLDARTGQQSIKPFHPPLGAAADVKWQMPTLVDDNKFLIADSRGILYLVGAASEPEPHLSVLASVQTPEEIVSQPGFAANLAYVVARGGAADMLLSFVLPDPMASSPELTPHKQDLLDGRVEWGPHRVGERMLVATDGEGLVCLAADPKQNWKAPLPYGKIVGQPLTLDDDIILASQSGIVWRIAADTGKELSQENVGERLASGPVPFGKQLVVPGSDGVIHLLPIPVASPASIP